MPINMPVKTGGSMELILKSIDTLSNVGILPNATRDALKQQSSIAAAKEKRDVSEFNRKEGGVISQEDYLRIAKDYEPAKKGEQGALSIFVQQAGGPAEYVLKPGGIDHTIKRVGLQKTIGDV